MDASHVIDKEPSCKGRQPIILTVDDNEDNLLIMNYVIEQLGISCVSATNGAMALSSAIEYLPDLILLDILLPDINGIEVFHQLKNNPLTNKIPVIAVTGLALKTERELLHKTGFDAYLCKPYCLDELEKKINKFCQKKNCCQSEDFSYSSF